MAEKAKNQVAHSIHKVMVLPTVAITPVDKDYKESQGDKLLKRRAVYFYTQRDAVEMQYLDKVQKKIAPLNPKVPLVRQS